MYLYNLILQQRHRQSQIRAIRHRVVRTQSVTKVNVHVYPNTPVIRMNRADLNALLVKSARETKPV